MAVIQFKNGQNIPYVSVSPIPLLKTTSNDLRVFYYPEEPESSVEGASVAKSYNTPLFGIPIGKAPNTPDLPKSIVVPSNFDDGGVYWFNVLDLINDVQIKPYIARISAYGLNTYVSFGLMVKNGGSYTNHGLRSSIDIEPLYTDCLSGKDLYLCFTDYDYNLQFNYSNGAVIAKGTSVSDPDPNSTNRLGFGIATGTSSPYYVLADSISSATYTAPTKSTAVEVLNRYLSSYGGKGVELITTANDKLIITDDTLISSYFFDCLSNATDYEKALYHDLRTTISTDAEPTPPTPPEPPSPGYGPDSKPGGGGGGRDDTSDPVGLPVLPDCNIMSSRFIRAYNPDLSQLAQLSDVLWSKDFVDSVNKFYSSIGDAIINLAALPVEIPINGAGEITVGGRGTGVTANLVSSQYLWINFGTVRLDEYWGNALDYAPYTRIRIFLPFCGSYELDTQDVMNATVELQYNIDLFTGGCVACLRVTRDTEPIIDSVLYQFTGNIASTYPVTGTGQGNLLANILSGAGHTLQDLGGTPLIGSAFQAAGNAAVGVASGMKGVTHTGSLAGNTGILGVFQPYIQINRPIQSLAAEYNNYQGYPSNITMRIGDCSGYTEIERVHLEGIFATDAELKEIEQLLQGGVII